MVLCALHSMSGVTLTVHLHQDDTSTENLQSLNLRAVGKAVRGDVLLARVRPRPWVIKVRLLGRMPMPEQPLGHI